MQTSLNLIWETYTFIIFYYGLLHPPPRRSAPRAGYMGHVVLVLRELVSPPPALPPGPLQQRWSSFTQHKLMPLLQLYDSPLVSTQPRISLPHLHQPTSSARVPCDDRVLVDGHTSSSAILNKNS